MSHRPKKNNRKKGRKDDELIDEDELLNSVIQQVQQEKSTSVAEVRDVVDVLKPDLRQMDPENEMRGLLGQHIMKSKVRLGPSSAKVGKVFRKKPNWPSFTTLARTDKECKWFRVNHSEQYRGLQFIFAQLRKAGDYQGIVDLIFSECPYHLESLLLMAHNYGMQEEQQNVADTVERALFALSEVTHQFNLLDHTHCLEYRWRDNRVIFHLLWCRVRELMNRHCFGTALQYGKILLARDFDGDPLAMILLIDFLAVRSGNFDFLVKFYETYKKQKNLEMLPNFLYSTAFAYAQLFDKTKEVRYADQSVELITTALVRFPSVVTEIVRRLKLEPTAQVKQQDHFNPDHFERNPVGVQVLVRIYLKHAEKFLTQRDQLEWLQGSVTTFAENISVHKKSIADWKRKQNNVFVGLPVNIKRHALLIDIDTGVDSDEVKDFFDPFPPTNEEVGYSNELELFNVDPMEMINSAQRERQGTVFNALREGIRLLWPGTASQVEAPPADAVPNEWRDDEQIAANAQVDELAEDEAVGNAAEQQSTTNMTPAVSAAASPHGQGPEDLSDSDSPPQGL